MANIHGLPPRAKQAAGGGGKALGRDSFKFRFSLQLANDIVLHLHWPKKVAAYKLAVETLGADFDSTPLWERYIELLKVVCGSLLTHTH